MGPLKVLACPAPNTYRLDVPATWRVFPELNVERLRPYLRGPTVPAPPAAAGGPAAPAVQELLKFRVRYGRPHVLVRWAGRNVSGARCFAPHRRLPPQPPRRRRHFRRQVSPSTRLRRGRPSLPTRRVIARGGVHAPDVGDEQQGGLAQSRCLTPPPTGTVPRRWVRLSPAPAGGGVAGFRARRPPGRPELSVWSESGPMYGRWLVTVRASTVTEARRLRSRDRTRREIEIIKRFFLCPDLCHRR
jgi:hypothetical protein